jgi:MFS family permease
MLALLRRNPSFRRLFAAQLVSYCGDWFANVALIGLLLDLTGGSGLAASLVFLAATLPAFLMTPIAGPATDRFDRRRLLLAVCLAQSVAALGFLTVGHGRWWLGLVAQALVSGLGAFVPPITGAAVPNLVDEGDLRLANVLLGSTWGTMLAVGASLGGLFTSLFGRTASFVADAGTFVLAGALVLRIERPMQGPRRPDAPRLRPLADTAAALRYARREPAVLALLGSKMGFGLTGGVVAVLPLLSTETFSRGDSGTGLLLAARGVGVVLGPFVASRLARRGIHGILLACAWSALVFAGGYALVAASPLFGLALVAVALAHLGGGAQWTLSTMGLQLAVPDALRGRVLAADFALVSLSLSISLPGFGALGGWLGPEPALLVAVATSAAWGLAYLVLTRRVRAGEPSGAVASAP